MQYYFDGADDLIRIDAPENVTGPMILDAPAQRYHGADLGWRESPQYRLPVVALYSGDHYPVDAAAANEIMADIDAEAARLSPPQVLPPITVTSATDSP
jgi:hypothetical protein